MSRVLPMVGLMCAVLLCASLPAHAQVTLDVSKITCWQFVAYKVTDPKYLAVWISGFHHGKSGDTVVDMQTLVANSDKLVKYCAENPDTLMMDAAAKILEPQK